MSYEEEVPTCCVDALPLQGTFGGRCSWLRRLPSGTLGCRVMLRAFCGGSLPSKNISSGVMRAWSVGRDASA